ncbi:MAG: DNA polymerase I [bacterium]|nr:DNA polymerase I [bacterium]
MPKLYLIDGSSYIFRAFYGIRSGLSNRQGQPTNAVFGFKNMLLSLLRDHQPTHVAMVFDTPGPCFRNQIYDLYKANRDAPPEELKVQFEPIFELVELLNFTQVKHPDYEADDIIGTLAQQFRGDIEVVIVSGDKDLAQLVTNEVHMFDSMKDMDYGPAEVREKWGVGPEMIDQLLALTGDSSDNIPGAPGIGPKTALKLFEQFGDIPGIYANLDQLKGKQKENLENNKAQVDMSLKLTRICCDVPLDYSLEDFSFRPPKLEELRAFYQHMNFREDGFFAHAESTSAAEARPDEWDYSRYRLITDEAALAAVLEELKAIPRAAIDFETTNIDAIEAEIVGISLAWPGGDPVYIPTAHETGPQVGTPKALELLGPLFADPNREWVAQNVKYELLVLANYGLKLKGRIHDSMIASFILDVDAHRHNLDELSRIHLGHEMIHFEDLCGKGKKQIPFAQVDPEKARDYGAEDAEAALLIFEKLEKRLVTEGLDELYGTLEMPLARVLATIEHQGVLLDTDRLELIKGDLQGELVEIERKIYELAGKEFNLNSTQQLGQILFEEMGITDAKKKTKTGYSTDASVLEQLAPQHEIAAQILEYRERTKLVSTYLTPLPELISPKDGHIHTSFSQTTAATGRLASKNPNLQNIPIRSSAGRRIRTAFVADQGSYLVSADYSQIELRFLAHLTEDPALVEVFKTGRDIHAETAAAIYGLKPDQVAAEHRRAAKAINFGIIYGMGAFRLSKEIGVSNAEAKRFIDAYFARYPKIQSYMDETLDFARDKGYVETLFGRRRPIREINSKNHMARTGAERAAINSRIQGSAADLIKLAMIQVQEAIEAGRLKARMTLQVHDELVFEVPKAAYDPAARLIKQLMEGAADLKVPLIVEVGKGDNWGEAH